MDRSIATENQHLVLVFYCYTFANMYSVDSAFKRLDSQDKEIIQHVLNREWAFKRAMILGSGKGRIGIVLALMGFEVVCVDIEDHAEFYISISKSFDLQGSLKFVQADISKVDVSTLSSRRNIIIAQRVFQYLQHKDTRELVQQIHKNMLDGADLFINISSTASIYAKNYPCLEKSIEARFCVPEEISKGLEVSVPMCLYSEQELLEIFDEDFWNLVMLENNAFGNIKAQLERA